MTENPPAAAATVDYDTWVKHADGSPVRQSTADSRIKKMVAMLDLHPGARVLEIGTGSGYSSAVLAGIVGESGHVVSIDVDQELVARAATLHAQAGHQNVEVHAADGFQGWAQGAPFDRVIAWTTPHVIPAPWVEQTVEDGVIVTPVKVADIACANVVVRCEVTDPIRGGDIQPGSFIEMAPDVVTELGLPIRYVDASVSTGDGPAWWISAHELHNQPGTIATSLLNQAHGSTPLPGFLPVDRAKREAFNAFVLAKTTSPASLGTSWGWGIGVGFADSIAVVLPDGALMEAGTSRAHDQLAELVDDWHECGELGHDQLTATFEQGSDGWTVRARLRGGE